MRFRTVLAIALAGLAALGVLWGQKPFREWPAIEYEHFAIPPDANRPAEWTRARLRYPDILGYTLRGSGRYPGFAGYWTMDYPRSDRHLLAPVESHSDFCGSRHSGKTPPVCSGSATGFPVGGIGGSR